MRIYKILKTYPGLNESFKKNDLIFESSMNVVMNDTVIFKKAFFKIGDPFIIGAQVFDQPNFFEKIEGTVEIHVKTSKEVIIEKIDLKK